MQNLNLWHVCYMFESAIPDRWELIDLYDKLLQEAIQSDAGKISVLCLNCVDTESSWVRITLTQSEIQQLIDRDIIDREENAP